MATEPEQPREDEALNWDGDESLTAPAKPLPRGWRAVGKGSEGVPTDADQTSAVTSAPAEATGSAEPVATSNGALIALGIFGGVYLLYTIGWIISGINLAQVGEVLTDGPIAYAIGSWIAAAAPAIWFALALYLTRGSKMWVRIAWLVAGMVLLVPWPFVMTGVAL